MKKNGIVIMVALLTLTGCGSTNGSKEAKQNDYETDSVLKKAHYYLTYSDDDVGWDFTVSKDVFLFKDSIVRSELYGDDKATNLIVSFTYDLYSKEGKGDAMFTFVDSGMIKTTFSFAYDFSKKTPNEGFYGKFTSFDLVYPEKWPTSYRNNYPSLFLADAVQTTIQEKCLNVIDDIAKVHDYVPA